MENASKALLIVGGMLIGVIILSIFSYVFETIFQFSQAYQDSVEQQRIIAFNAQYTKYVTETGEYIYAEDVVTLVNQTLNWNQDAIDSEKISLNIVESGTGRTLYSIGGDDLTEIYKDTRKCNGAGSV